MEKLTNDSLGFSDASCGYARSQYVLLRRDVVGL